MKNEKTELEVGIELEVSYIPGNLLFKEHDKILRELRESTENQQKLSRLLEQVPFVKRKLINPSEKLSSKERSSWESCLIRLSDEKEKLLILKEKSLTLSQREELLLRVKYLKIRLNSLEHKIMMHNSIMYDRISECNVCGKDIHFKHIEGQTVAIHVDGKRCYRIPGGR
jgi:hypothetical protein